MQNTLRQTIVNAIKQIAAQLGELVADTVDTVRREPVAAIGYVFVTMLCAAVVVLGSLGLYQIVKVATSDAHASDIVIADTSTIDSATDIVAQACQKP